MKTNSLTIGTESRRGYWWRVLRPLIWWLLLVLALFAVHQHQLAMERTRLYFSVWMCETNAVYDAATLLDGRPLENGAKISPGSHQLTITQPKAERMTTNFFAWYGRHDLGKVNLKRAMGILAVSAEPPAKLIRITGPEFSQTFFNSAGTNLTVPTDQYAIDVQYPHWSQTQNISVSDRQSAICAFTPRFGALHLTCNHDGATYVLRFGSGQEVDSGNIPAIATGLPVGSYEMTAFYHQRQIQRPVLVEPDLTNNVPAEFILGAVRLESVPAGANVNTPDGNYLGQTPLDLGDVTPQAAQFSLSLPGYEPLSVLVAIVADQKITVRTNLLNIAYGQAIRTARQYRDADNYSGMSHAATEALAIEPNDSEALTLQATAAEHLNAARQQTDAEQIRLNAERQQAEAAASAQKQRQDRLNRPHDYFVSLMSQTPNSADFVEHQLKANGEASDLRSKIADALSKSLLLKFTIEQNDEPFPEGFLIRGKLPMLDGFKRCYIVGGQTADGQVTILFKVLEYTWPPDLALSALLSKPSDDKAISIEQSNLSPSQKESRRELGIKIVTERIQQAISQQK